MIAVAVAHLLGNALLLLAGYYWLGLSEASGLSVLGSALVFLLLTLAALWLHGTAMVYFRCRTDFRDAALRAARNLLPLLPLAFAAMAIYWLLSYMDERFGHSAFVIGSYATMKTRKPVSPSSVLSAWHVVVGVLRWLVVPALLFPIASAVADHGWPGFGSAAWRRSRKLLRWLAIPLLLGVAVYLPLRLVHWVPGLSSFALQMASFTVRFGVAYLLFVGGLLAVEWAAAAPRVSSSAP